ncbi:MAG: FMN-binding protein [Spirochaetaceae bacterium]
MKDRTMKDRLTKPIAMALTVVLALVALVGCGNGGEAAADGPDYEDGVYFATYSHVDGHGWQPFLEIEVENGEIVETNFDYAAPDGSLKSKDRGYRERMESVSGTHPARYSPELENRLMENQAAPVEAVSGATSSSNWFNELASELVTKAEAGDTEDLVLPMNDTYTAEDEPDERGGWIGHVEITYEDGDIVEVEYDELQKDGREITDRKSENEEYAERYAEINEITPAEVYEELESRLVETEDPEEVDVVSGATITSPRFRELAKKAMDQRVTATVPREL